MIAAVLVIGAVGALAVGLTALAIRVRRRGGSGAAIGAAMAAYDEAMNSSAHDAFVSVQEQSDKRVALPSPEGPPLRGREPRA